LAAGADVDALVVKDKDGLPFVPGKTIKGLVREAMIEMGNAEDSLIDDVFGYFKDKDKMDKGEAFFNNAELPETEKSAIITNKVSKFLYRSIASTAIDENGIAKEHSLRKMEVVVPCELEGEILDLPKEIVPQIEKALKYIKRLGQNRNRGLGRCTITVEGGAK
jgi:CRISPR/Cas system CSM-associated protein Csm3 (group 7 of RAMP superfamily)